VTDADIAVVKVGKVSHKVHAKACPGWKRFEMSISASIDHTAVQKSFGIGMVRLTERERERLGVSVSFKLSGHSRITNSSCLQGALNICCISVQQLVLQQSMLLPQRTNILVDLWEKVQQPAARQHCPASN